MMQALRAHSPEAWRQQLTDLSILFDRSFILFISRLPAQPEPLQAFGPRFGRNAALQTGHRLQGAIAAPKMFQQRGKPLKGTNSLAGAISGSVGEPCHWFT